MLFQLDFLLNGKDVEEMTMLVHKSRAQNIAKRVCEKLKEHISRQMFLITIQGCVGKTVLARQDIKPYRKDVTAKCVSTHRYIMN